MRDTAVLLDRREPWPRHLIPSEVDRLTAGVDIRQDRIEVRVWGWAEGEESWLVESVALVGDPAAPAVWAALEDLLGRDWPRGDGAVLRIACVGVDVGHLPMQVYRWAAARSAPRAMLIKGVVGRAPVRTLPARAGAGFGVQVHTVAVEVLKADFYARLRLDAPGSGYVHLPAWAGEAEVLSHVADEYDPASGRWRTTDADGAALDCRCYAHAALLLLGEDPTPPDPIADLAEQIRGLRRDMSRLFDKRRAA